MYSGERNQVVRSSTIRFQLNQTNPMTHNVNTYDAATCAKSNPPCTSRIVNIVNASRLSLATCRTLYTTLIGISAEQAITAIIVKSHRSIRRNRRNATASSPTLSSNSGSLTYSSGGSHPKAESEIFGGGLSPTWYFTLGS